MQDLWHFHGGCWGRPSFSATGRLLRFVFHHKKIAVTAALIIGSVKIWKHVQMKKLRTKWDSAGRDVVILHTVSQGNTIPSISPFTLKLETFFRMMNIKYEYDYEMPLGPKQKFPWITFNGVDYTDTELIIQKLQVHFSTYPDSDVPPQDLAVGQAMRVMVDEHLLWGVAKCRYIDDDMKSFQRAYDLSPLRKIMFKLLLVKKLRNTLYIQGLGRHSTEDLHYLMKADIAALSHYLGEKDFLYGANPHVVDCAIFGMMAQIIYTLPNSVYHDWIKDEFTNLAAYTERVRRRFWPDWEQCVKKPHLVL